MLQIVYWQSGAHFWDPPVNEAVDDVIFMHRDNVQPPERNHRRRA